MAANSIYAVKFAAKLVMIRYQDCLLYTSDAADE